MNVRIQAMGLVTMGPLVTTFQGLIIAPVLQDGREMIAYMVRVLKVIALNTSKLEWGFLPATTR